MKIKQISTIAIITLLPACCFANLNMDQSQAKIFSQGTIYANPGHYVGWPTVAKAENGDLIVIFSGNRQFHICPFGRLTMIRSKDNGKTWSEPEVLGDMPLVDDRDGGIVVTKEGTLIASWFTSAYFASDKFPTQLGKYQIPSSTYDGWKPIIDKIDDDVRNKWIGNFVIRSEDNGKTWGYPIRTHGSAPHGPVQLSDGRLIYVGKSHYDGRMLGLTSEVEKEKSKIAVEVSYDDGRNWQVFSNIPVADNEKVSDYHEPHIVEDSNGKLYVFIRYHIGDNCLRVSESLDGGKIWSVPRNSGIRGYPAHLLKLKDGRIIVSYGYRFGPFEERAVVIDKNGNWDAKKFITLAVGHNYNLGYPSSVELEDGSIYTVYYQESEDPNAKSNGLGGRTVLMATHWKLK